jgi:hypothetical protein
MRHAVLLVTAYAACAATLAPAAAQQGVTRATRAPACRSQATWTVRAARVTGRPTYKARPRDRPRRLRPRPGRRRRGLRVAKPSSGLWQRRSLGYCWPRNGRPTPAIAAQSAARAPAVIAS